MGAQVLRSCVAPLDEVACVPLSPRCVEVLVAAAVLSPDAGLSWAAALPDGRAVDAEEAQELPVPAVDAGTVMRAHLRSRALQCLWRLAASGDAAVLALGARGGLIDALYSAALAPVCLPSFVPLAHLADRAAVLRARAAELAMPGGGGAYARPGDADAPDAVRVDARWPGVASGGVVPGAGGGAGGGDGDAPALMEEVSPEDIARRALAEALVGMFGLPLPSCLSALRRNGDDPDRAAEWLMSDDAARVLAAEAAETAGARMQSRPRAHVAARAATVERDSRRWSAAAELSSIYGQPAKLCFHALMMHGEDPNAAMGWLMDFGGRYGACARALACSRRSHRGRSSS